MMKSITLTLLRRFPHAPLFICLLFAAPALFASEEFNLNALEFNSPLENTAKLTQFIHNNALMPGRYLTAVYVNNEYYGQLNVQYALSADKQALVPQFTRAELHTFGVKVEAVPALKKMADAQVLGDLAGYIPDARYEFQPDSQRLDIRIPQVALDQHARDYIDPSQWDDGLPAFLLNYYYSGAREHHAQGDDTENHYLDLNAGLNVGAWRLRHASGHSSDEGTQSRYTSLQRDIKPWRSQLVLGETSTTGEVFDSLPLTGLKLETDTDMLPFSEQGFAPSIHGIAQSDAKVTVKQNGYVIYQTYVAPGPFEINDLNQVASGSDLDVTVTEADGSEHRFIQASASVPIMQRQGALKYSLAGGRYRSEDNDATPDVAQATLIYGLPYGVTLYGGAQGAAFYHAAALGLGIDLHSLGSLSLDATAAASDLDDNNGDYRGTAYRTQYAKNLGATQTTLTLASYRYATAGFYTFEEATDRRTGYAEEGIYAYRDSNTRRSRLQLTINQPLGKWGSLYASGYQQDYWDMEGHERNISLGVNSSIERVRYSLNYTQTQTPGEAVDKQIAFTLSVPLDKWLPNAWANYNLNRTLGGKATHQLGISGTALADDNLNYNLQQSVTPDDGSTSSSATATYRGSHGVASLGYNTSPDNRQVNYSLQGGLVVHPYGVTLAQSLPETVALVRAPGAAGVKVESNMGLYTDRRGYAVVPNLTGYRKNRIALNTQGQHGIDIPEPVQTVIPSKGAVVLADFDTRIGSRMLVTLRYGSKPVPFGAIAAVSGTTGQTGIVGEDGEVYLSGINHRTALRVKWGDEAYEQCRAILTPPADVKGSAAVVRQTATCR
jgi:outer membrane usher protein